MGFRRGGATPVNNVVVFGGEKGSSRALRERASLGEIVREQAVICGEFEGFSRVGLIEGFWGSSERRALRRKIFSMVIFEDRGIYEEEVIYGGDFSTK